MRDQAYLPGELICTSEAAARWLDQALYGCTMHGAGVLNCLDSIIKAEERGELVLEEVMALVITPRAASPDERSAKMVRVLRRLTCRS